MKLRRIAAAVCAATSCLLGAAPAVAQDIQERNIRWGHLNTAEHSVSFGVKKFAEVLKEKSGGKLKIQEFPASQLGNELQQQSALRGGTQEMFSSSTSSLAGIVKEAGIFDFPFNVDTPQQSDALVDGAVGTALLDKLRDKDLIGLVYWDLGFRQVTNSRRPIATVQDFEGLKLRVVPNPVYVETFKLLKANPVPMAFAEVYGALESKAIDGQENPLPVIASAKLNEVQKYVSATNHVYTTPIVLVSRKFWDSLSPTEQRLMRESAVESRTYQRRINREQISAGLQQLKAGGMIANDLSDAERIKLREVTKPVFEKISTDYDPAFIKLFREEMTRVHALK
jgi:tripartite ATP-independent transporter DctP family solute receptor